MGEMLTAAINLAVIAQLVVISEQYPGCMTMCVMLMILNVFGFIASAVATFERAMED